MLLALADRCDDYGRNAWPAVATIAAEVEIGTRTTDRCLSSLRDHGLIIEQLAPRQHRPRTWRLNLEALVELSDPQHRATLGESRPAASCDPESSSCCTPDPPNRTSGPPKRESDPPNGESDPHDRADDPVLLIRSFERPTEQEPAAQAPRSSSSEEQNLMFLKGDAFDVVHELGAKTARADVAKRLKAIADERGRTYDDGMIGLAITAALNGHRFGVARKAAV